MKTKVRREENVGMKGRKGRRKAGRQGEGNNSEARAEGEMLDEDRGKGRKMLICWYGGEE